mmetsp:Transcript_8321/g.30729  ORF Transcript_8321/g.30729 Transcript_8321/m.30729 type:complete len:208 (+) Transcript_8321:3273-3896(+)
MQRLREVFFVFDGCGCIGDSILSSNLIRFLRESHLSGQLHTHKILSYTALSFCVVSEGIYDPILIDQNGMRASTCNFGNKWLIVLRLHSILRCRSCGMLAAPNPHQRPIGCFAIAASSLKFPIQAIRLHPTVMIEKKGMKATTREVEKGLGRQIRQSLLVFICHSFFHQMSGIRFMRHFHCCSGRITIIAGQLDRFWDYWSGSMWGA